MRKKLLAWKGIFLYKMLQKIENQFLFEIVFLMAYDVCLEMKELGIDIDIVDGEYKIIQFS